MKEKLIIYYDSDCGFCKKACYFLVKFLRLSSTTMAWISSDQKAQDIFVKEYSWSVYSFVDTRYYTKSSAFWRLVKASPFSRISYISSLPGVLWLGDIVYDVVARHRSRTCAVGLN